MERQMSNKIDELEEKNKELLNIIGKESAQLFDRNRQIETLKEDLLEAYDEISSLLRQIQARDERINRQKQLIETLRETR